MQKLRGQLTVLVPAVFALFVLRVAEPRPGLYFHEHPGGDHAHVHGDAITVHGWDDVHPHLHTHPHSHAQSFALAHSHASDIHHLTEPFTLAAPHAGAAGLNRPGTQPTGHWHTQSVFDRSLAIASATFLGAPIEARVADIVPVARGERPLPDSLARGPPALVPL